MSITRDESLVPNPDSTFLIQVNDLVALIGTREARGTVRAMAAPGDET